MHKASCLAGADRVGYWLRRDRGGKRKITSCHRLSDTHDIGFDSRMFPCEQLSGTSEACRYLVEYQYDVLPLAKFPGTDEESGRVEIHASCPLYDRFQDQGGDLVGVPF